MDLFICNINTKMLSSEQRGEQLVMVPFTIPRFLFRFTVGKGEFCFKFSSLCPFQNRVLSPILHTPLVSRLPFPGVLQRPRACFFPVLGIHPDFARTRLKKSSAPIILQGSEPLYFLRAQDLVQVYL